MKIVCPCCGKEILVVVTTPTTPPDRLPGYEPYTVTLAAGAQPVRVEEGGE